MNLYVSNLSFKLDDGGLRRLFESFGEVISAKVILHHDSGKSRGFGFVEMKSNDEANRAMASLNGKEIAGRAISVTLAREREKRKGPILW